jgi:hypothetical protein
MQNPFPGEGSAHLKPSMDLGACESVNPLVSDQHLTVEELRRGVGLPWLFVIDDFLVEPDTLRQRALELTYDRPGHFPGRNSAEKIKLTGLTRMISEIVRERLHTPWSPDYAHQSCRLALASDDRPGRVHIDTSHWTGVLSLSRNADSSGGTEFFRHRRTGLDRFPLTPEELAGAGYSSYEALDADILQKDALDRSRWEPLLSVPMRYNRLILLQPHYWHTAGPGFGTGVENGRLVYLMFFNRVPEGRPAWQADRAPAR